MNILLADDHILFRDALTQFIYITKPNWLVTQVSSKAETLEKIRKNSSHYYDTVLMDVRMPDMDGLNGLEHILGEFPDLKIAIISNIAREIQVRAAMNCGATAYLPKTLPGKTLVAAIHLVANGEKFVPIDECGTNIMPSFYDDAIHEQDNADKNTISKLHKYYGIKH